MYVSDQADLVLLKRHGMYARYIYLTCYVKREEKLYSTNFLRSRTDFWRIHLRQVRCYLLLLQYSLEENTGTRIECDNSVKIQERNERAVENETRC